MSGALRKIDSWKSQVKSAAIPIPTDKEKDEVKSELSRIYLYLAQLKFWDYLMLLFKSIRTGLFPLLIMGLVFTVMSQGLDIVLDFVENSGWGSKLFFYFLVWSYALLTWTVSKFYIFDALAEEEGIEDLWLKRVLSIVSLKKGWAKLWDQLKNSFSLFLKSPVSYFLAVFNRLFTGINQLKEYNTALLIEELSTDYSRDENWKKVVFYLNGIKIFHRVFSVQIFVLLGVLYASSVPNQPMSTFWILLLTEFCLIAVISIIELLSRLVHRTILLGVFLAIFIIALPLTLVMMDSSWSRIYIANLAIATLFYLFFVIKNKVVDKGSKKDEIVYTSLVQKLAYLLAVVLTIVILIASFVHASLAGNDAIDHIHIIVGMFIFYLFVLFFIKSEIVWLFLLLLCIVSLALFSDLQKIHHAVPLTMLQSEALMSQTDYFNSWKQKNSLDTAQDKSLYLVLAEGGGSRAALWTYSVLDSMNKISKGEFYKRVLFQSGASGGLFGLSLFQAKMASVASGEKIKSDEYAIFSEDFLSLPLFYYLGKDLFVGMFPWLNHLGLHHGRASASSMLWQERFTKHICAEINPLDSSVQSNFGSKFYPPMYMINTTHCETGGLRFTANFKVHQKDSSNILTKINERGQTISLLEASSLGARFPLINPAGYIPGLGHFVDAGYFDNYGIHSLMQFLSDTLLLDSIKKSGFQLKLILVHNGKDAQFRLQDHQRFTENKIRKGVVQSSPVGYNQLFGVAQTLYKAELEAHNVEQLAGLELELKSKGVLNIKHIYLDHGDDNLPLAWDLSEQSAKLIRSKLTSADLDLKKF